MHMIKPLDKDEWEYLLLALDVKGWSSVAVPRPFFTDFLRGHSRVILEQAQEKPGVAKALKIFGIQWR